MQQSAGQNLVLNPNLNQIYENDRPKLQGSPIPWFRWGWVYIPLGHIFARGDSSSKFLCQILLFSDAPDERAVYVRKGCSLSFFMYRNLLRYPHIF